MIGYHFTSLESARAILESRKLKISLDHELNDPFEGRGATFSEADVRAGWEEVLKYNAANAGVICFSTKISQPIMWSHYADRHRGICLGFDLADEFAHLIIYSDERRKVTREMLRSEAGKQVVLDILSTKHLPWAYESELRFHARLEKPLEDGKYYRDFDEQIKLREILVGCRCSAEVVASMKVLADAIDPSISVSGTILSESAFEMLRAEKNR